MFRAIGQLAHYGGQARDNVVDKGAREAIVAVLEGFSSGHYCLAKRW
jgi:hypothetical protein